MNQAVMARLHSPDMSLFDCIRLGGFVYDCDSGSAMDIENVTLAQRKNQLNRRLRRVRSQTSSTTASSSSKSKEAIKAVAALSAATALPGRAEISSSSAVPSNPEASLWGSLVGAPCTYKLNNSIVNSNTKTVIKELAAVPLPFLIQPQNPPAPAINMGDSFWGGILDAPCAFTVDNPKEAKENTKTTASRKVVIDPMPSPFHVTYDALAVAQNQKLTAPGTDAGASFWGGLLDAPCAFTVDNPRGAKATKKTNNKELDPTPFPFHIACLDSSNSSAVAQIPIVNAIPSQIAVLSADASAIATVRGSVAAVFSRQAREVGQYYCSTSQPSPPLEDAPFIPNIAQRAVQRRSAASSVTDSNSSANGTTAASDPRQDLALACFEREPHALYNRCMRTAGFTPQESDMSSPAYRKFAFSAWRRECERLQALMAHYESQDANSSQSSF